MPRMPNNSALSWVIGQYERPPSRSGPSRDAFFRKRLDLGTIRAFTTWLVSLRFLLLISEQLRIGGGSANISRSAVDGLAVPSIGPAAALREILEAPKAPAPATRSRVRAFDLAISCAAASAVRGLASTVIIDDSHLGNLASARRSWYRGRRGRAA